MTSTTTRHLLTRHTDDMTAFLSRHGDVRVLGMGDGWTRDEGRELLEGLLGYREGYMEEDEGGQDDELGDERDR